ncbi:hypothetical protein MUP77_01630 [Candidatus Bathyarchaeota archaeon]|nr:hypothetical protein [Candidatus Bathyarchaeota archaeon]
MKGEKMLVAFDVDGTLECGSPSGPIKLETVRNMKKSGMVIGIISPSLFRVKKELGDLLDFYLAGPKAEAMFEMRKTYSGRMMYVGDCIIDENEAHKAGWEFCYANKFQP